ncbi:MAG: hypothetical protein M3Y60_00235, partial [Bacteroidota bacterium]|nr:hypothetical protein [Bacteroidota bacterium]
LCRHQTVTRIFSLFTGIVFLNMSFFLAEVCLLNFQDKQMIENVCKLVLNGGLEEERDAHSAGGDVPQKIFPLIGDKLLLRHSSLFLIAIKIYTDSEDHYRHADHSKTFSPPPDVTSRISLASC